MIVDTDYIYPALVLQTKHSKGIYSLEHYSEASLRYTILL